MCRTARLAFIAATVSVGWKLHAKWIICEMIVVASEFDKRDLLMVGRQVSCDLFNYRNRYGRVCFRPNNYRQSQTIYDFLLE